MGKSVEIDIEVNGTQYRRTVPARTSLADFLRDDLGKTGTHLGCEQGVCGSCTVLKDGRSVRSCIQTAAQASRSKVETVEGVTAGESIGSRVAEALSQFGGLQCGFCTPGFVVAATELIASGQPLDEHAVRVALSGNTCRCTGYSGIVTAVLHVYNEQDPK